MPSPGYPPDPGTEQGSPALQADFLPADLPGKPKLYGTNWQLTESYLLHEYHSQTQKTIVKWQLPLRNII